MKKVEQIQERCLTLPPNNQTTNYQYRLKKSENSSMEVKRLLILAIKFFKTLNSTYKKYNLYIHDHNTLK